MFYLKDAYPYKPQPGQWAFRRRFKYFFMKYYEDFEIRHLNDNFHHHQHGALMLRHVSAEARSRLLGTEPLYLNFRNSPLRGGRRKAIKTPSV